MIKNYLKTALRFLSKNISFAVINLIGLTTGIAAFMLIALYLQEQLSYDRHLPHPDRTFRLVGVQEPEGLEFQYVSITSAAWKPYIEENIPQVEESFRVMNAHSIIIEVEDKVFRETSSYFSEGKVLQHMGYPILHGGEPGNMLARPNQAVISRQTAERFFNTADVIGKSFRTADETYIISGVFENEHINTHLNFNILLSFETIDPNTPYLFHFGNNTLTTYVVANPDVHPLEIEDLINAKQISLYEDESTQGIMRNTFYLQEVGDIFLRSGHIKFHMRTHEGSISNVYIFSIVALLILAIACINFINLATANSAKRAREVGLRKVMGAGRNKLAFQFIGESMLITFASIVIALGVIELILPQYNALLDTDLKIDFTGNYLFSAGLLAVLLVVGMVSGFYPALYLSRFQPAHVLRAGNGSGKPKSAILRKVLVIFQFVISTGMILSTAIILHQVNHMENRNLGYNSDNVITVINRQTSDYEQIRGFRNRLMNIPEVTAAGISSGHNGVAGRQSTITTADSIPVSLMVRYGYVDPDFFPAMEIPITVGRNFSHDYGTDPRQTMIINRATQRALGWENPIGKQIVNTDDEEYDYFTVIGVIEDYHYYSLRSAIEPAIFIWRTGEMPVINLRYRTSDHAGLMTKIEKEFEQFFPGYYFQAFFMSDLLARQYRTENNTMRIFMAFAFLCILISCLGLFGLTSFMVNQKRKEISIRKVLGGSVLQINMMLLKSFMRWILVAAIIALPFTWSFMDRWLSNYAYRISIGIPHIFTTLLIIVLIAAATVLTLSTRAAMQNPASAIKYE
ncbi:MAG: ABC transporter permease [Bacteroidetes bacterium]|nr:MAG: ABC transporter permease [Bacteroidota bacterium]